MQNPSPTQVRSPSPFSILQLNLSDLETSNSKLLKKKSKLEKLSSELHSLSTSLSHSKAQRDMQIGLNYLKLQQKRDEELLNQKSILEKQLIKIKEDHARLRIQVQEQEDLLQMNLENCKLFDNQIQKLSSELESIKCISPPSAQAIPKPSLNNSFSVNIPIQLNAKRQANRRSESFGGFK
jgi:chromosome segregation ATPase